MMSVNKFYECKGCIHIHSTHSDGSGTIRDIVAAGKSAAVDFLVITDHDRYCSDCEGWYDGILVLLGAEFGRRRNHYLALNIKEVVDFSQQTLQESINKVNQQQGLGFIAHPAAKPKWYFGLLSHNWTDWKVSGYTGIELWTFMFDWIENVHYFNLIPRLLHPIKGITGPPAELLARWDRLTQQRRVVAIGGLDAHAHIRLKFLPKIPSYAFLFGTIRTHILADRQWSGAFDEDASLVYRALAAGRCYIAHDYLGAADGFSFTLLRGKTLLALMGDEVSWLPHLTLQVSSPLVAKLRLIRNGKVVVETKGDNLQYSPSAPAVYRVEAFLNNSPWVYTNPIYIRGATDNATKPTTTRGRITETRNLSDNISPAKRSPH